MELSSLTAVSPVDGRYRKATENLAPYFSEYALIKYRLHVEIEYLISLSQFNLPQFAKLNSKQITSLRRISTSFSYEHALKIKAIEKITNHDVKAVEYFLKEKMKALGFVTQLEFVHFGLTSQDINNTSVPLSLKEASNNVILPQLNGVVNKLKQRAKQWEKIPMLARTHGQAASPTRLGKEIYVFVERLLKQIEQLKAIPYSAKFGGATGNFNAHFVAYPDHDWIGFGNNFVENVLELSRSRFTTQIEHYDNLAAWCDASKRINTVLTDFCRDMWTYNSYDYFKQKLKAGEVGSSAMPHKVNPIDFENAEGNLGLASSYFEHLSAKLPISRLQRDLSDSTVLRNLGVPVAYTLIALKSIIKGLDKLILNDSALKKDLDNNWAVVGEAIQTVLRREGFSKPYEVLKDLTRGKGGINKESLHKFIDKLKINNGLKSELKKITPHNYTGKNPKMI